jgi:hypothetical protein
MCTKYGSDWFRNVDLYKVQTNKQSFSFIYKMKELLELRICFNCLVAKMRNAFCNLVSKNCIALSYSIIMLVEYVVSSFSVLYWKPRLKSFISSFVKLISVKFLLKGTKN